MKYAPNRITKTPSIVLFLFVLMIFNSCKHMETNKGRWIMGNEAMYLTPEQIQSLEPLALSGDADAAFRLANYQLFITFDSEKGEYWMRKAALAGDTKAQYNLAALLSLHTDQPSKDEALKWCQTVLAAKPNDEYAIRLLKEMNEKPEEQPK